jgi:hypothetical protein
VQQPHRRTPAAPARPTARVQQSNTTSGRAMSSHQRPAERGGLGFSHMAPDSSQDTPGRAARHRAPLAFVGARSGKTALREGVAWLTDVLSLSPYPWLVSAATGGAASTHRQPRRAVHQHVFGCGCVVVLAGRGAQNGRSRGTTAARCRRSCGSAAADRQCVLLWVDGELADRVRSATSRSPVRPWTMQISPCWPATWAGRHVGAVPARPADRVRGAGAMASVRPTGPAAAAVHRVDGAHAVVISCFALRFLVDLSVVRPARLARYPLGLQRPIGSARAGLTCRWRCSPTRCADCSH